MSFLSVQWASRKHCRQLARAAFGSAACGATSVRRVRPAATARTSSAGAAVVQHRPHAPDPAAAAATEDDGLAVGIAQPGIAARQHAAADRARRRRDRRATRAAGAARARRARERALQARAAPRVDRARGAAPGARRGRRARRCASSIERRGRAAPASAPAAPGAARSRSSRCASRSRPLRVRRRSAARCASSALERRPRRAARTSSAAAVGVGARRSAARSASVTSVSWPTPLTTGIGVARDRAHDALVVEGPQVLERAAAAAHDQHVDLGAAPPPVAIAAHQRGRRVDALHQARIDDHRARAARAAPAWSARRAAPRRRAR